MDIIFKEYGRVIWQKKGYFLLALIALGASVSMDVYVSVFYKNIANGLAQPYSESVFETVIHNLGWVALLYACIWLSWRFLEVAIIPLDGGGVNLLEKRCFEVLKKQKYGFFENQFSGSLVKQAGRFSRSFEIVMDWFLFQLYQNSLAVIVSFVIFYQQQPEFALYFLVWVIVFVGWSVVFSLWKLRFDKAVAEGDSKVGGVYSDAISNISIVKSFAMEATEQAQINQASDGVYKKKKIAWILMFISFAIQGMMALGMELLLVYLMIQKWKKGHFEVGEFVLFQSIFMLLIHRLWDFGRNFRTFFSALADAAEMAEVFRCTDLEVDVEGAKPLQIKKGEIHFDSVDFSYSESSEVRSSLFKDFSLEVRPGEKVALVGHSGSGKTTLTKMLFRFVDPQKGSLKFDGMDARAFTLESLRRQISLIPQQPELFHRSVRDNITLGRPVTDAELTDVVKKAQCLEFIENFPEGIETLVGERGVKLSGGERQRIAIARAFLEDAPIVVLDEATSALDSLTEKQIQVAVFELIKNKTAIVIAHRLSTILRMDRIVVMEKGRIIEQGTHQGLLKIRGKYFQMWEHQSGSFL
ncbi:ABC transporter ATP-binding protein [Methylicorpusculum sp.]|uniref:ABC transporter ATP-binding protein n=1 Tax=Methylicorpusculum sp. TaxID=2713644 RepID=UPI002717942D|nr:ABC transporter ATP-binding protein [Methylicorpusculum sp.]MDO8843460.1 ABC transporter ATP-binding protein [Methylicorpusculum sp.]MDO9239093.1 ABC transporter ATP-binding protein [Methylicorpusculum sp.]MDP2180705.1 ABC transporter ATP-binding protein [Methylicorpusculum sp.]MDZ4149724.1 ABC transporter ATP-binding protein [Methylicorpusculum sp.]